MTDAHRRAAVAERAARAGGAVARDAFRGDLAVETKADATDLVTETDRNAQRQVIATVREEFAADAFVCEEDAVPPGPDGTSDIGLAESVPERGDAWVVDPIDGTSNFVRGSRLWATSVAAVVDSAPVGAATYLPAVGDVYTAGPDSAARNGQSLSVSDRSEPETFAVSVVGRFGPETGDRFGALARAVVEGFGDLRRIGSMQSTLAAVAAGELEGAIVPDAQRPWDTLAGVRLVRSGGGTVTDLAGEPWALDDGGLVASNGRAHEDLVGIARRGAD